MNNVQQLALHRNALYTEIAIVIASIPTIAQLISRPLKRVVM